MTPTERKQRFADAYAGPAQGNGVEAARLAGFTGTNATLKVSASRLLKDPKVIAAIANLREKIANHVSKDAAKTERRKIADATERRELLSRMARKTTQPIASAKAIDILNKMDGVYVQKHEHVGPIQVMVSPADERI